MLLTALADHPATPTAAVNQVADAVQRAITTATSWQDTSDKRHYGGVTVLSHPHLSADHPAFHDLDWATLRRALTSPLLTPDRTALLLTRATPEALTTYLQTTGEPHPAAFTAHHQAWANRFPRDLDIWAAAHHPAAPAADATRALQVAVAIHSQTSPASADTTLTAATRHPDQLAHLATLADRDLATKLRHYAAQPDPYTTRITDVISAAQKDATGNAWVRAISETRNAAVVTAAMTDNPSPQTWYALLETPMPDAIKSALLPCALHALVDARCAGVLSAPDDIALIARLADFATLTWLAGTTALETEALPVLLTRADLPGDSVHVVLERLTDTYRHERSRDAHGSNAAVYALDAILAGAARASIHPNTTPDDRIRAYNLTTATADLRDADRPQGTTPRGRTPALLCELALAGKRLATTEPADVARDLAMELVRATSIKIDGPALRALVRNALTAHAGDLTRPEYTRALLTLEPAFTGTLGQLLDTARTITT